MSKSKQQGGSYLESLGQTWDPIKGWAGGKPAPKATDSQWGKVETPQPQQAGFQLPGLPIQELIKLREADNESRLKMAQELVKLGVIPGNAPRDRNYGWTGLDGAGFRDAAGVAERIAEQERMNEARGERPRNFGGGFQIPGGEKQQTQQQQQQPPAPPQTTQERVLRELDEKYPAIAAVTGSGPALPRPAEQELPKSLYTPPSDAELLAQVEADMPPRPPRIDQSADVDWVTKARAFLEAMGIGIAEIDAANVDNPGDGLFETERRQTREMAALKAMNEAAGADEAAIQARTQDLINLPQLTSDASGYDRYQAQKPKPIKGLIPKGLSFLGERAGRATDSATAGGALILNELFGTDLAGTQFYEEPPMPQSRGEFLDGLRRLESNVARDVERVMNRTAQREGTLLDGRNFTSVPMQVEQNPFADAVDNYPGLMLPERKPNPKRQTLDELLRTEGRLLDNRNFTSFPKTKPFSF